MKKFLLFLLTATLAFGQNVNVQKAGDGTNAITGNLVVGSGRSITPSGTGDIRASSVSPTFVVPWNQVNKTGSSLADLQTRSASDLSSGTLPDARFPSILPAGSVSFNLAGGTGGVGNLTWNPAQETLDLGLNSQTTLQIGQEQLIRVQNSTGTTLTDGQLVYISGSQGQRPVVSLAQANTPATSSQTIGMVTQTIADGAAGFVTVSGIVNNVNTNGYADGTQLWLSPTTPGGYTSTQPSAPNHSVAIGYVVKGGSAGGGSIFVNVKNGEAMADLHDVVITAPVLAGSTLLYDAATPAWRNARISAGTGLSATYGNATMTLANTGVTSISGTAGQVNASGSTGNVTLSLPSTITQATTFSGGLSWSGGSVLSTSSGILRFSNGRQFDISGSASSLTILDATGGVAPLTLNTATGTASIGYTTASSNTTTGALVVNGGAGVAGALNVGSAVTVGTDGSSKSIYVPAGGWIRSLDNWDRIVFNSAGSTRVQGGSPLGSGDTNFEVTNRSGTQQLRLSGDGEMFLAAGKLTGGASGLTLNAGGSNQNITLTPSGTGVMATGSTISSTKTVTSVAPSQTQTDYGIRLRSSETTGQYSNGIAWAENAANVNSAISGVDFGAGGAHGIAFITGNNTAIAERARITDGGNLLIGTTTDRSARLRVVNDAQNSLLADFSSNYTAGSASPYLVLGSSSDPATSGARLVVGTDYLNNLSASLTFQTRNTSGTLQNALTLANTGAATFAPASGNTALTVNPATGGILVNSGAVSNGTYPALQLSSSGAGWGSGMQFRNTTATTGRTYGIYAGSGGPLSFTDETALFEYMTVTGAASNAGRVNIAYTTPSTSTSSGAFTVAGGAGVGGKLYVGDETRLQWDLYLDRAAASNIIYGANGFNLQRGAGVTRASLNAAGDLSLSSTTASTSTTTGALTVSGGVGVAGALNVGGYISSSTRISAPFYTATGANTQFTASTATLEQASAAGGRLVVRGPDVSTQASFALRSTTSNEATAQDFLSYSAAGALTLNAGGTNQNITLTPSGTGAITLNQANSGLNVTATAGDASLKMTSPSGGTWDWRIDNATGNYRLLRSGGDYAMTVFPSTRNVVIGNGTTDNGQRLQVSGTAQITGNTTITASTASTSTSTGALVVSGGVGVAGNIYGGGNANRIITSGNSASLFEVQNNDSSGTAARSQINALASGYSALLESFGSGYTTSNSAAANSGRLLGNGAGGFSIVSQNNWLRFWAGNPEVEKLRIYHTGTVGADFLAGYTVRVQDTTASTSTTTGALTVAGGLGVNGSVFQTYSEVTNSQNGQTSYLVRNANTGTTASAAFVTANGSYTGGLVLGGTGLSAVGPLRANRGMLTMPFDLNYLSGYHNFWVGTTGAGTDPANAVSVFLIRGASSGSGVLHMPQNSTQGGSTTVGIGGEWRGATLTNNTAAASSTVASQVWHSWGTPTFAASNSNVTITDAATMYVQPPVPGTNATLTNRYAIWTAAGGSIKTEGGLIVGSTGTWVRSVHSASASLDFPSISANSEATLTITVTGATVGDVVSLGWGAALDDGIVVKQYWVSATDTVSIRVRNVTGGSIDPASQTVRAQVTRF